MNSSRLPVQEKFISGIDVGGSKIHIADSLSTSVHRYVPTDFPDLYALLDAYFEKMHSRPSQVTVAMAGPRNSETGEVRLTNFPWPPFSPQEAAKRFPDTNFETTHDMTATVAGIVNSSAVNFKLLKPGKAVRGGVKLGITISTGVGVCAGKWDQHTNRYVYFSGEAGHIGFQPYDESQRRHLKHIFTKYDYPSVELALSGKFGIESWIEHSPEMNDAPELMDAVRRAEAAYRPVGAVLLEFATEGAGGSQKAARTILTNMGSLAGSALADYALAYLATGGIYLTGSVSLGLGEYWAKYTDFNKTFVRRGTNDHASWLEELLGGIPIYLVTDSNIAAQGALMLAREQ